MKDIFFAYVLGALTFWPLVILAYISWLRSTAPTREAHDEAPARPPHSNAHGPQWSELWNAGMDVPVDRESDTDAACWVYFSTLFVRSSDPADEVEGQQASNDRETHTDGGEKNARSSLKKIVGNSALHNHQHEKPLKTLSKLPKYWAVVRGGQLQLYEDQKERKLFRFVALPQFVVTLWPQNLQEFELFYKRYPVCLVTRGSKEGLVTLDLAPGVPPRDALYFYVDNPTVKEDLYFALIKGSKLRLHTTDPEANQLSLGPRDPVEMARPLRPPKVEIQELQSQIWGSELPNDSKWLNALIGRLFFGLKNSQWADDYLRRKFTYKLRPISSSSGIIGDIEVRDIHSGASPPFMSDVKLRELTPEGNLVLSAKVKYTGGARVHLSTMVKLSAVTSLTTAEIPIELAATLRRIEGTMVFRIKPAPSDRIWYAFESMPDIDLHMEPVVYETQISLSVVTKFIKNRVVETLRESLVMPYMDDLSFYDTSRFFYRGGIWEPTPSQSAAPSSPPAPPATATTPNGSNHGMSASSASSVRSRGRKEGSAGAPDKYDDGILDNQLGPAAFSTGSAALLAAEPPSKVRKFSDWVKRKRSTRSLRTSAPDVNEELDSSSVSIASDSASFMSLSPGPVRPRTASTTHVTQVSASTARQGVESSATVTQPSDDGLSEKRRGSQAEEAVDSHAGGIQTGSQTNGVSQLDSHTKSHGASRTSSIAKSRRNSLSPVRRPNQVPRKPVPVSEDVGGAKAAMEDKGRQTHPARGPSADLSPVLGSPEKWKPTAVVSKPQPSLAESNANASGIPGESASVINQELWDQEERLRRKLSQGWSPKHSQRNSVSGASVDQQSIGSSASAGSSGSRRKQPSLPPRNRRYVPLTNVPPEHTD